MHTTYQVTKNIEVFGLVQNLFNQHYYSAGTFFDKGGFNNSALGGDNLFTFNDPERSSRACRLQPMPASGRRSELVFPATPANS